MQFFGARLLVSDFPAALRFWRDAMKLSVAFSDETMGYAYFTTDGSALELFNRNVFAAALGDATPTPQPVGRQTVLVFKVDDVDAAYADLIKHGATSTAEPQDRPEWRARTAHISDPDGHLIEIYSQLPESDAPTA